MRTGGGFVLVYDITSAASFDNLADLHQSYDVHEKQSDNNSEYSELKIVIMCRLSSLETNAI